MASAETKTITVTIKHGKTKHSKVSLETGNNASLESLQAIIFSLTQVMPERQKIIVKGKKIACDDDVKKIKKKSIILVMGSAEETINISSSSVYKFADDMTAEEKQEYMTELPPGLYNLGNTCYLNSALQCIKTISELKESLKENSININDNTFSLSLGKLFNEMDGTSDSINPVSFVQDFRTRFPNFATRNEQGVWEQQDADECLTKILNTIKLDNNDNENLINQLFCGEFESSLSCDESEEEPIVETVEEFMKLRCFIDKDTSHISTGIEKSLSEKVEKNSEKLGRNAVWTKHQRISKLPKYLTISMVRFFWKANKQRNAKILRKIPFDFKFDVTNLCNQKLKSNIGKFRRLQVENEDKLREKNQMEGINIEEKKNDEMEIDNNDNNDNIDQNDQIDDTIYNSGFYQLIALITHKGLSANSGHYIGYGKDEKRGWLKFDDDTVTQVKEDDIKALYGGGQHQMGYVCFYKKIDAKLEKDTKKKNEKEKKKKD